MPTVLKKDMTGYKCVVSGFSVARGLGNPDLMIQSAHLPPTDGDVR